MTKWHAKNISMGRLNCWTASEAKAQKGNIAMDFYVAEKIIEPLKPPWNPLFINAKDKFQLILYGFKIVLHSPSTYHV